MNSFPIDKNLEAFQYKECQPEKKPSIPGRTILKCSEGSFGPTNFNFSAATSADPRTQNVNEVIASVTIDTSCLCCPRILIDFTGVLTSSVSASEFSPDTDPFRILEEFDFTLYKTCRDSNVRLPVKTFTISQGNTNTSDTPFKDSRTLKFEYFSCEDQCGNCCTYTLELTSITDSAFAVFALSINGTLCAHAVESSCRSNLTCSEGCFGPSLISFVSGPVTQTINKPIASVTIDTACLRCPSLLIDFAGILTSTNVSGNLDATFNFTLFKSCSGSQIRQPVKNFTLTQSRLINATIGGIFNDSRTLKFEYFSCDEDQCEDCCTYTLELTTATEPLGISFTLSINGTLCARTIDSCCFSDILTPEVCDSILKCSEGGFGPGKFNFSSGAATQNVEQPIASVTIDTSCLRCQKLLIDFAGVLNSNFSNSSEFITSYNFTLFKSCKGSKTRLPVKTFNFHQSIFAFARTPILNDSRSLKLEYFTCDDQCGDCCTYTLELTSVVSNTAIIFDTSITGTLCVLAVESC